jgi:UPF0271 protein
VRVDVNADVGESFGRWRLGDDLAMLPYLTSANVACGFHAGDPATMLETVTAAVNHGVAIGAQVSYPDLVGFGRRSMQISPDQLKADVLYQIGALDGICRALGTHVRFVKPHGALYHRVAIDDEQATALVTAIASYGDLPLVHQSHGAAVIAAGVAGVRCVSEGFADREYVGEIGRSALVPRETGGVITDPDQAAAQAVALLGVVDTICVHGDTPGAPHIAAAVRTRLTDRAAEVAAFA